MPGISILCGKPILFNKFELPGADFYPLTQYKASLDPKLYWALFSCHLVVTKITIVLRNVNYCLSDFLIMSVHFCFVIKPNDLIL